MKRSLRSLIAAIGMASALPAVAADIPCDTARLIVPWKAGGGIHIIFLIFEKTIQLMDIMPKVKVVTVLGQGGNKGAKEARKAKPDGFPIWECYLNHVAHQKRCFKR